MLIQAPNYYRPPGWDEFDKRATIAGTTPYFSRAADVNRFGARYRLARAFKGLDLDGYSIETKIGYEALTKVTLHWSAFEQLKKSINMEDTRELVKNYNFSILANNIRKLDADGSFFKFLKKHLSNNSQAQSLSDFIEGKNDNLLLLSKFIRHIFLHGPLSANVSGNSPLVVREICDLLSDLLVTIMNKEFKKCVDSLVLAYP